MKEIAIILAFIQIFGMFTGLLFVIDLSVEIQELNNNMRDADTQDERNDLIKDYMDDFADDLVNITKDEVESLPQDIIIDAID